MPPVERPGYSVTSLIAYETCPLQYYTTYVRGIPPPVTPAMQRGTSIHKLIADHLQQPELLPREVEPELQWMLDGFKQSRFNRVPVLVEAPFTLPLPPGDVRGRVDIVLPRGQNGLEVVDFKSGSVQSRDALSRSLQLPLYTLAMSYRFGKRPDELAYTYYFLRYGKEVSFAPTAAEIDRLVRRVERIMEAIQRGEFRRRAGCRCYACRRIPRGRRS